MHINSGIPNKAFFLTAINIGGYAWEAPGHIWYESLKAPGIPRRSSRILRTRPLPRRGSCMVRTARSRKQSLTPGVRSVSASPHPAPLGLALWLKRANEGLIEMPTHLRP